ncbi:MAG: hypothetical protein ACJ8DY_12760 [Xanthobacteraceae bacterium]
MVVGCAIGRVSMKAVSRSILIFYVPMLIVLALVTYVPALSLWLPSNGIKLPTCPPCKPQPQRPNFFQVSATSVSGANSPWSASIMASLRSSTCSRVNRYCGLLAAKVSSNSPAMS